MHAQEEDRGGICQDMNNCSMWLPLRDQAVCTAQHKKNTESAVQVGPSQAEGNQNENAT